MGGLDRLKSKAGSNKSIKQEKEDESPKKEKKEKVCFTDLELADLVTTINNYLSGYHRASENPKNVETQEKYARILVLKEKIKKLQG